MDELEIELSHLVEAVVEGVILNLLKIDPILCRWFILDIFLQDAESEGTDVAQRINLLIAEYCVSI